MHPDHELNRASWNELAAVHGQDAYYDSETLVAGVGSLIEEETAALTLGFGKEFAGRQVLHVQCHIGFDAITFARRGACVTGVDFSPVALAKARLLAIRCDVDVEWVCADATELPGSLHGKFDLAWATMGVLCWIADIRAWMRSVAAALAPSGRLILIDGHPEGGETPPASGFSITDSRSNRRFVESGWDYATPTRTGPQIQFRYSLLDIASAAKDAGLRVLELLEHTSASCDLCIKNLKREEDGRYRHRVDNHPRPVLFTLIAVR